MKRVGKPWFFVVALLIFALAYTAFFGVYEQNGDLQNTIIRGAKDIRWGTDIQGGVNVIYGPEENIDATDNQIDSAKSILEIRLVSSGVTDYELYADKDNDRLLVSFPWKDNDSQNVAGTINFTLLGGIGDIRINQTATKEDIYEALDFYREC